MTCHGLLLMIGSCFVGAHVLRFLRCLASRRADRRRIGSRLYRLGHADGKGASIRAGEQGCAVGRNFWTGVLPIDFATDSRARFHFRGGHVGRQCDPPLRTSHLDNHCGTYRRGCGGTPIFLCYGFADRMAQRLGKTAMTVVVRLSSFLLLCIGVQIMWNGFSGLLSSLHC